MALEQQDINPYKFIWFWSIRSKSIKISCTFDVSCAQPMLTHMVWEPHSQKKRMISFDFRWIRYDSTYFYGNFAKHLRYFLIFSITCDTAEALFKKTLR